MTFMAIIGLVPCSLCHGCPESRRGVCTLEEGLGGPQLSQEGVSWMNFNHAWLMLPKEVNQREAGSSLITVWSWTSSMRTC